MCDVGFYWIHPGLDSKEVARPRLDSVHQEESNRCFAGKWGESRGLPTGETEEVEEGQCSGGRHTSTARMEVHAGEDMLASFICEIYL